MNDKDVLKFTCNKCGGHELTVTHLWNIQAGNDSESWREWGPFKDNHHWQYEFKEKIEENTDDEVQRGDFGEFEEDDSASEPEDYEIYEGETSRESDEFFVNCGNCDREIEFGWSEPDRRGLILPVEFSDFNPLECWPDPKYVDVWQQRDWLRTGISSRDQDLYCCSHSTPDDDLALCVSPKWRRQILPGRWMSTGRICRMLSLEQIAQKGEISCCGLSL